MRAALLFEGIGGFGLATERVGMDLIWHAENDHHASRVLAHHWPDIPNLGDVHGISGPPAVDVLTGGFPCQDYSVAGRGAGLAGDRGALWWQFHRLIAECRPTWVVGENVHGLTTRKHRDAFRTIVGSLVDLGYGVVWRVLDAQFFGVAQRRRRVFIVGHSGGQPRPEVLALAQGVSGDTPPSRETGEGTGPTLAARTRGGGGLGTDTELDGGLIASSLTAHHKYDQAGNESWLVPIAFSSKDHGADAGELSPTLRAMAHDESHLNGGGQVAVAFAQNQRDELRELDVASSINAERWGTAKNETLLAWDPYNLSEAGEVSPTLAGLDHGNRMPHVDVRRLTPLECERLQGFPDHWTATPGNSDSQRYKQLGNAVAVPVAEWILGNIAKADQ